MTTRTVGTFRARTDDVYQDLLTALEEDERTGAIAKRAENKSVQAKIGTGLDVPFDHKFDRFETLMEEYSDLIQDGVVISVNDTVNQGLARYYTNDDGTIRQVEEYKEDEDEPHWGEKAAAVIYTNHGINGQSSLLGQGAT